MRFVYMSYKDWAAEFQPIEGEDGFFLREEIYPLRLMNQYVTWSLVQEGGILVIHNGYVAENIGYYVTQKCSSIATMYVIFKDEDISPLPSFVTEEQLAA